MTREEQMMDLASTAESNSRTIDLSKRQVFMSAYIQGWKDADSHPQWIPVEERLPKENEGVLAYNGVFNEIHLCDFYDGIFEDFYGPFNGTITHWMPLPQLPRKEE